MTELIYTVNSIQHDANITCLSGQVLRHKERPFGGNVFNYVKRLRPGKM
jgi:hypothetical protein